MSTEYRVARRAAAAAAAAAGGTPASRGGRLEDDRERNSSCDALRLAERRVDLLPSHVCCSLVVSATMANNGAINSAGASAGAAASATRTAAATAGAGDAVQPSGAEMEQVVELFQNQRQRKFKVSNETVNPYCR